MKAVLSAAAVVICAASGFQRSGQVFRSHVQTVFVDVSVLKARMPVTSLNPSDFRLTDNGAPQNIEMVADSAIPVDVTLVVHDGDFRDNPTTYMGAGELSRNIQQIAGLLPSGDRLETIRFGSDVAEARPMSEIDSTPAETRAADARIKALTTRNSDRYRVTEATLMALTTPVTSDRRHFVVVFTDPGGEADASPLEYLVPAAKRADALLYVVLTPSAVDEHHQPYPFLPTQVALREALTQAAEATGGKAYLTGDIVGAFKQLLREFRSSYVLRYTVQAVATAGWHEIVVKVPSCPTCTIRARRGYMGQ